MAVRRIASRSVQLRACLACLMVHFDPTAGGPTVKNMQLQMAEERLGDRRTLLKQLDRLNRQVDSSGSLGGFDKFEEQAFH